MNAIPKTEHLHKHHSDGKGTCCDGSGVEAEKQSVAAEKTSDAQKPKAKAKPAASSGCCGG